MKRATLGLLLTVLACGGKTEEAAPPAGGAAAGGTPAPAATPAGGGEITGTVSFTGTAPANPAIDMSEEAACKAKYTTPVVDSQVAVNNGKLANVLVYVKSGLPAGQTYPAPAAAAVIDQEGCLYKPRMLAVVAGQNIEIKNSDPLLHNIKAVPTKNRGFNISQPTKGMSTTKSFTTPEVTVPLQCSVHGWMHANVGVMENPFFATSGGDGSFSIKGLPAGEYEVEAVHPKLGTKTVKVTVPATGAATAAFTFAATAS